MNRKLLIGILVAVVIAAVAFFWPKTYSYPISGEVVKHKCIGLEIPRPMVGGTVIDCYGILIEDGPNCNFFCGETIADPAILKRSASKEFNKSLSEILKTCQCERNISRMMYCSYLMNHFYILHYEHNRVDNTFKVNLFNRGNTSINTTLEVLLKNQKREANLKIGPESKREVIFEEIYNSTNKIRVSTKECGLIKTTFSE